MTLTTLFGAMLAENLVLCELLGLDLFACSVKSTGRILRIGAVFTIACAVSGGAGYLLGLLVLPDGLFTALHALVSALIGFAASMGYIVWNLEDAKALGAYLPLAGVNTAALALMQRAETMRSFSGAFLTGIGAGIGFVLVSLLFSGMRERLRDAEPPAAFAGAPILMLSASLLCLAFAGLSGLRG